MLLSYISIQIFQACITSLKDSCSYEDVKKFLLSRYSTTDTFLDRISFLDKKYASPIESFAADLNSNLDSFTQDISSMREELVIAKLISSAPKHITNELKLRRPTSVSECIQIVNSLPTTDAFACSSVQKRQISEKPHRFSKSKPSNNGNGVCFRCASEDHRANDPKCPAKNATCRSCQKIGHYAAVCKSRTRVATVIASCTRTPRPEIVLKIAQKDVSFIVDTGAEVTILCKTDYDLKLKSILPLATTGQVFNNFDGSRIHVLGVLPRAELRFNQKSATGTCFVADVPFSVLGMDMISALRLTISAAGSPKSNTPYVCPISSEDDSCMHIRLKPGSPSSIIQPLRRLPFALEQPVEEELHRLLREDVIEPIESSPYVSPIITAKKPDGSLRLCIDYRRLNENIIIDQHPVPTADELFSKIKEANFFTKIDLRSAFHQVKVAEDSRDYTAFISHQGLFRYKKVPFGLANSPAVFNRILNNVLKSCSNTVIYFDDILTFAKTEAELTAFTNDVKDALKRNHFVINENKCVYAAQEVEFLGRQLSAKGIRPPPQAISAISECPQPTSKHELRVFLGLVNFFRNFIPRFASIASPLYRLLQDDCPFSFGDTEKATFCTLKKELVNSSFLSYFDTSLETKTILCTDASLKGIGAMLSQEVDGVERPVYFVSRQLKPSEKNYSSSELETLAAIWSIEKLHQFLFGRKFELRTDHIALKEVLTGSNKQKLAPARICRWAARLLPYTFSVVYIRGSTNKIADCLSRLPVPDGNDDTLSLDINIAAIHGEELPCLTYTELRGETHNDEVLRNVTNLIQNGWPPKQDALNEELRPYHRFRDELSYNDGIVLRGEKILVPISLRTRLLHLAHQSHMGLSKTKSRLRQTYWWPAMDTDVENLVRNCFCCRQIPRDSPVQVTEWCTRPWNHLAIDIAGPKFDAHGKPFYLIALVDNHSKYVMCRIVRSIVTRIVIDFLKSAFAIFGLCAKITTDNGVQFTSNEFVEFLRQNGIAHSRSAIYNPQANGGIERVNRNFKKLFQTFQQELVAPEELQTSLDTYLLNYNNTYHQTTSKTPSELLFSYRPRTKLDVGFLPSDAEPTSPEVEEIQSAVQDKLEKRAKYANERRRPKTEFSFQVGDWVQMPPGPIRQIVSQCGKYTFTLNDGFKVNARRLRLIKRPSNNSQEVYCPVPSSPTPRYPKRSHLPVSRYGFNDD